MKQPTLTLLLFVFSFCALTPTSTFAQCSIAACKTTGAFAYAYNDKNESYTMAELRKMAMDECKNLGGTQCEVYFEENTSGWWAFMVGFDNKGYYLEAGTKGVETRILSESNVRKIYEKRGGVDTKEIKVASWYVYSNNSN